MGVRNMSHDFKVSDVEIPIPPLLAAGAHSQSLTQGTDEKLLVRLFREKLVAIGTSASICIFLGIWDAYMLATELLWRVNKDLRFDGIVGPFLIVLVIPIQLFLQTRKPTARDRQYFEQYSTLPKSKWPMILGIAIVPLVALACLEFYIWFFWQYPFTSWFTGRHYS